MFIFFLGVLVTYSSWNVSTWQMQDTLQSSVDEYMDNVSDEIKLLNSEMVGYVKDDAWAYENEVRLRVDVVKELKCEAVALEIPDYVYDAMIITAGPRYTGNIEEDIRNKANRMIKTSQSMFAGKLRNIFCDNCNRT